VKAIEKTAFRVEFIDHRSAEVAHRVLHLLEQASAQEASLLGLPSSVAGARSLDSIQASADFHLGVWSEDRTLLGLLSIGPDDEPEQLSIGTLVVLPQAQRQGIARALLLDALARGQGMNFAVTAAAANTPALTLYRALGFAVYRHGITSQGQVPLVKLRRAAAAQAGPGPA
jgi:ribosomal protein S18 acetylase RimI-like enzyme